MNRARARVRWQRVPAPVVDIVLVAVAAVDVWPYLWDATCPGVALAGFGCAALVLRRRFPLAVFLVTLPIALTQEVAVATLVALFTLAERSRNRPLLAGCVALAAVVSIAPWPLAGFAEVGRAMTLIDFVYSLATSVAPVLFGQLLQAHRDLARRLAEIEEAREHERVLHAQAVLARERVQLAREMHDVVSHQVSLIAVQAGALQVATPDASTKEAARTIRSLSVTTLDELRTMVTLLRASGGRATELTPQPTLADLHRLVESSGTQAELSGALPPAVGTPAQRALYRTVQEALTNVRKHAPGATARVELWQDGDNVGVTVTNSPPTHPSLSLPGSQHGLVGLRERADILHGTLEASPTGEGGYRVRLRIPLSTD
ncbi:histidine kinase [Streptomyces sp. NRRL WC-3618]|uniref:sensor histidine kinase n=1 Tax=Streptomyces sp. NRRL WC-3618 TaxID=1519490 RepID=UPI0006ADFCDA|nr:histidine kinase [Streptomyces sp. NRRL WC-3618]KOV61379.1 histidine kinase [Streptomyces sp. NRRL WC-3618]